MLQFLPCMQHIQIIVVDALNALLIISEINEISGRRRAQFFKPTNMNSDNSKYNRNFICRFDIDQMTRIRSVASAASKRYGSSRPQWAPKTQVSVPCPHECHCSSRS
jgi:hypothetical protein